MSEPVAVYVHVPFCSSKCAYCDFNSFVMDEGVILRTTQATIRQIEESRWAGRAAKTIFFGGGTPSLLPADQIAALLEAVMHVHPPQADCEITSECNPGTVSAEKLSGMRQAGFNRLSIGAQSFRQNELVRLGREHEVMDVCTAVSSAREVGFENINLDLMFALPGQSINGWRNNLKLALSLGADHLSLYGLTIEPNTRFFKMCQRGTLDLPSEENQVRMYDLAVEMATGSGLLQYEISNFSVPGRECRHNLCYWRSEEYLGYGPGAVGCVKDENSSRVRYTNIKHPVRYSDAISKGETVWCEEEELSESTLRTEQIMLGLRLNRGVDLRSLGVDDKQIQKLIDRDWLLFDEFGNYSLTATGRHLCSEATLALI